VSLDDELNVARKTDLYFECHLMKPYVVKLAGRGDVGKLVGPFIKG
jgi:hypothetical protein